MLMGTGPAGHAGSRSEEFGGTRPVRRLFEMIGELGRDLVDLSRADRGQALPDETVDFAPAARQLPVIEDLSVQRVREFIPLGREIIGKALSRDPSHHVMPTR